MRKPHDDQVDCLSNHTACAGIQSLANPRNAYVAILTISELTEDDQNNAHSLLIHNDFGTTTYSVRIQTVEGNWPQDKDRDTSIGNILFKVS